MVIGDIILFQKYRQHFSPHFCNKSFSRSGVTLFNVNTIDDVLELVDTKLRHFLGVIFGRKISYNEHICKNVNNSMQVLEIIKRTCEEMKSIQTLRTSYLSLVRSNLMYASCV